MGITIHYTFQRRGSPQPLNRKIMKIAQELGWKVLSSSWNNLILHPSEECESLELHWRKYKTIKNIEGWDLAKSCTEDIKDKLDDEDWVCGGFCKTQYAGYKIHIQVAELLRKVASRCELAEIHDEGGYYEELELNEKSILNLKKSFNDSTKMIDNMTGILKQAFGSQNVISGGDLQ